MIHPFFATAVNPAERLDTHEVIDKLEELARRCDTHDLDAVAWAQAGPGLLLSIVEDVKVLTTVMYHAIALTVVLDDLREKIDALSIRSTQHAKDTADLRRECAELVDGQANTDEHWRETIAQAYAYAYQCAYSAFEIDEELTALSALADDARSDEKEIENLSTQWEMR